MAGLQVVTLADDQQINVRVWAKVAASFRAEKRHETDLFGKSGRYFPKSLF